MNSKSRRFFLYLLLIAMVVTQVAFTKTEESNTSDESVVNSVDNTGETETEETTGSIVIDETEEPLTEVSSEDVPTEQVTESEIVVQQTQSEVVVQQTGTDNLTPVVVVSDSVDENLEVSEELNTEEYLGLSEETEVSEYQDMIVCYADPYLPVRTEADRSSSTVGKLFPGSYADIVERGDEWTKIKSGNVEGYIQNIYVCFDDEAEDLAQQLGGTLSTGLTIAEEKKKKEEEAKKNATVSTGAMSLSSYEEALLAAIVDWESNAEPYDGQKAVAYVVLNRVRSSNFGNSVEAVLLARGQFGGVTDGNGNWSAKFQARINKYTSGNGNASCIKAAKEAIAGTGNPLNATYYYFNTVVPSCSQSQQIGHHTFYNY